MTVQALWRSVLLQALTDGLNSPPVSGAFIEAGEEIPPRDYILISNPDFEMVCVFAGADPEALRRDFRVRLAERDPLRPRETWEIPKSNRRPPKSTATFTHKGRTLTLGEWADSSGLSRGLLMDRVNRLGWSIERALTEPTGRRMPKPSYSDPAKVMRIAGGLRTL